MTVPSTSRRAGPFLGNDSTTVFSFSFKTFAAGDLLVTKTSASNVETTLTLATDYTVTLNGDQDVSPGGIITYPVSGSPLAFGEKLTIIGDLEYEQTTDLLGGGAFNARVIEDTFDRAVIQIQQVDERVDRALTLPVSASSVSTTLPLPQAGLVIGWNTSGTGLQNYDVDEVESPYGNWTYSTFTGNGTTTAFALAKAPGNIANVDVSINGLSQVPVVDFSLSGALLTFVTAPPNGTEILARYGLSTTQAFPSYSSEQFTATAGQTIFNLTSATYVPGSSNVAVYVNGLRMVSGSDYTETNSSRITFTSALTLGDEVTIVFGREFPDGLDSSSVGFAQTGTGAVARTVQSKLRDVVSVKDFGAVGDGVTDDTAAIQAAIEASKPVRAAYYALDPATGTKRIYLPAGVYLISSPLSLYSFQDFVGDGPGTLLKASGGFSGTALILLKSVTPATVNWCVGTVVSNLSFIASVAAIRQSASNILNCLFSNLTFTTTYGLMLDSYTQACVINRIYSGGSIDQIVFLKGNWNLIEDIDKEQGTGATTEAYVELANHSAFPSYSDGNTLRRILIEGTGSVNKTPIKLYGTYNTTIYDFWGELSTNNGYQLDIAESQEVNLKGTLRLGASATGKIKLSSKSYVSLDFLSSDAENVPFYSYLDVDSTSYINIEKVYSRVSADRIRLDKSANIKVLEFIDSTLFRTPVAGMTPYSAPQYLNAQNLLINPSFEAGRHGWAFFGSNPTTEEYIASDVATGLMGHFIWSGGGSFTLVQSITLSAAQVGKPMTISALVKITGASNSRIVPIVAGLYSTTSYQATSGSGWQVITMTAYPTASGAKDFGFYFLSLNTTAEVWVDEVSVSFGELAPINAAKFGSLELNGKTFTTLSAAPTTGTWKVGDHVFNSAPAVGSPKGWICTVAGTPGTWVSEGNL